MLFPQKLFWNQLSVTDNKLNLISTFSAELGIEKDKIPQIMKFY